MVAWWKRLIYSLVSAVLAAAICGGCIAAQQLLSNPHRHLSAVALWTTILAFDPWVIILSLPGWALSIPIVLMVKNIRGWRFWFYWAVGVCFGPAIVLAVGLYSTARGASFSLTAFSGNSMSVVYVAAAISGLTALIYLMLLRSGQNRAAMQESPTPA